MKASSLPRRQLNLLDNSLARGGTEQVTGTPATISAAIYFARLPSKEMLEKMCMDLLSFDTFRSRPVDGRWEPAPFDLPKHLLFHELSTDAEMDAFIETTSVAPLRNKEDGPWWEVHAVTCTGARSMVFFRVDHTVADGISLTHVINRIATKAGGEPLDGVDFSRPTPPARNPCALLCEALGAFVKYAMSPVGPFDTQLPILAPELERRAGLTFSGRRRIAHVKVHSLANVKAIKNAAGNGVTVNDVIFAAFSGALRRQCQQLQPAAKLARDTRTRALVPLAFPRGAGAPLSNDWTFLSVPVPLGLPTHVERLAASHQTFHAIKASPEAAVARLAVQINSLAPPAILGTTAQQLFSRHTLVFSNVPGPAGPVYVGGERVLAIRPVFPNLIPQVLCLSYDGALHMSIAVDPDILPDPDGLGKLYLDELDTLMALHGLTQDDGAPTEVTDAHAHRRPRAQLASFPTAPTTLTAPAKRGVPPPPPARSPPKGGPPPPPSHHKSGAELL